MIRFFAAHPTAANIVMLLILFVGMAVLPSLNKEALPEIPLNKVSVSVAYLGASPSEVEEGICNRLEDATDGISFMREQICEAREGMGKLTLEMQEEGDLDQFINDVNAAVDSIVDFPSDAEEPVVVELGRTSNVVSIAIISNLSQPELKALAEHYRNKLLANPEVPIVTVSGFSTHELSILIQPETLRQYQLSVQDIANLVKDHALDLPVGILETTDTAYQIRFENLRRSSDELADLVVLNNDKGGQIRLGDIARIENNFSEQAFRTELDGRPSALLKISKNKSDDSLSIFDAVASFVEAENARLPETTHLLITQDLASIVEDRLNLLLKNAVQGLILATMALFAFFSWRYTFWIAAGLPISFIGGLAVMAAVGISINMISMVALLMAIGILMDDAIVIAESIEAEYRAGRSPLEASVAGIKRVGRGVLSSFTTSALLFGSLLLLKGEIGQMMRVLPIVLLAVLVISLVEAFLILPHHLKHSLEHHTRADKSNWRLKFEAWFGRLTERVGVIADAGIRYRYLVVGGAVGLLIFTLSLMVSGVVKFKAFPDLEGNVLEARVLMPQGTTVNRTEAVVAQLLESLQQVKSELSGEDAAELIRHVQVSYGTHAGVSEEGEHLATVSLDLLDAEARHTSLNELRRRWQAAIPQIPDALSIQFREPALGPGGQAISIRLQGDDLEQLSAASWQLQNWLNGYPGISNVMDDLRPGKPQFVVRLHPGFLDSDIDARMLASQLRSAYQGTKVSDVYQGREAYEINVKLDSEPGRALSDLYSLPVFNRQGESIPLVAIAQIEEQREFSLITRVNHQRAVTVSGDIDAALANTNEIVGDTMTHFVPQLRAQYPGLQIGLEGEVKNNSETNRSLLSGFLLGIVGVYLLLALQFGNYREPAVVMFNIPLALIGAVWGHVLMGLDFTVPSMIGFVSLAGIVVNDSILLVEFVKLRAREGLSLHDAAVQAVRDRFRAIFLTSLTTVAGMLPLLSETSLQAQVLVPIVVSIVFGMLSSTVLIMIVLPAAYAILEDFGFLTLPTGLEANDKIAETAI